ncbi:bestrophin family protein [Hymenobacter canadensis]|uniref:Bestrophin family ion channel n=1 Tax=Hymenobacter canadensis TaxID=2999067 RepID=A0ABY7LKP7_9BACT|nr:bestrophin family ion channel [Hymenobacter canadensis]WBA40364.1 bestrophin family ion channel [Hymenobacter canadensis]
MLLDTHIPVRYILKHIQADVLRVLLISIFFHLLKLVLGAYLPLIPLQLPTILGSLISLLLAFKTAQSYDRWWEARKLWGGIVNDSRTLVLQARTFLPEAYRQPTPAGLPAPLTALAYRQMAWCYSLGQALRGLDPAAGLRAYLAAPELAQLTPEAHKPLALLALHAAQLRDLYQEGALNAYQQVQLDSTLLRLTDAMGQAERIKTTVFPVSYRLLVYYFIYLFLMTLSLGLVKAIGLWEIPVLLVTASSFFLLERTARYLQDPFSNKPTDTPVTAIARTIESNLRQLLHEPALPVPPPPTTFYLM